MPAVPDLYAPDFFATLIADLNPTELSFNNFPPDIQIGNYTLIGFMRPAGPWYLRRGNIILMIKKREYGVLGSEGYSLKLFDETRRVPGGSVESSVLAVREFWGCNPGIEALIARIKECVPLLKYYIRGF